MIAPHETYPSTSGSDKKSVVLTGPATTGPAAAPRRSAWGAALRAAAWSTAANALLFTLAVAAGFFPSLMFQPDAGAQMSIEAVLLVSLASGAAGIGVYTLFERLARVPLRAFLWIAAIVLLASFGSPLLVAGTSFAQGVVLNLMHVIVAGCVVAEVLRLRGGTPTATGTRR